MCYDTIKETARKIAEGSRQIYRLTSAGEQGRIDGGQRNVEASCLLGTSEKTDFSDTSEYQALVQEKLLEEYARSEKIWFEHENIKKDWKRIDNGNGAEAEIYLEKNGIYVNKVFHYINSCTPFEFIDNRISIHNSLFPATKYELLGFTRSLKGFAFILKQPFITGRDTTPNDNLAKFMSEAGFTKKRHYCYSNDLIEIDDLHGGNVLKGNDNNFYFIDTIPMLKKGDFYLDFQIY